MNFLEVLNKYWGIVLFLAGLIFHALWTYFKVGEHGTRINVLETNGAGTTKSVGEISNRITSIDAKLDILLTGYHKEK